MVRHKWDSRRQSSLCLISTESRQSRGIQKNSTRFKAWGASDSHQRGHLSTVARPLRSAGLHLHFLSDPTAEAIRRYDLVHAGAGKNGQDIARPAEFLLDSSGTVRWRNLTDDFRVWARPEQMIEAARLLRSRPFTQPRPWRDRTRPSGGSVFGPRQPRLV
jgi:peroxiredoxin